MTTFKTTSVVSFSHLLTTAFFETCKWSIIQNSNMVYLLAYVVEQNKKTCVSHSAYQATHSNNPTDFEMREPEG